VPGCGRKGYEFEREQLNKMRVLLNTDMEMHRKIQLGTATQKEKEAFALTGGRTKSIFNKLHADKKYIEQVGELAERRIIELSPESKLLVMKIIQIEEAR